jgi:hypothetical protein
MGWTYYDSRLVSIVKGESERAWGVGNFFKVYAKVFLYEHLITGREVV